MALNGRANGRTSGRAGAFTVGAFVGFRRRVRSMARAVDFYCGALGFRPDGALLRLGCESIELLEQPAMAAVGVPPAGQIGIAFQHIAIVTNDMPTALLRLARHDFRPVTQGGAVTLPAGAGGVTAFKFRDPDGHPLELLAFPPGTGDTRWQVPRGSEPTIGIDHSAIVVADAERSIRFYERTMGLTVASRQINRGAEQDRLDGLADTEVEVIALRPAGAATPHLELLAYRSPPPMLPSAAVDSGATDCIVWRLAGSGLADAVTVLRDPDGHGHRLCPSQAP